MGRRRSDRGARLIAPSWSRADRSFGDPKLLRLLQLPAPEAHPIEVEVDLTVGLATSRHKIIFMLGRL